MVESWPLMEDGIISSVENGLNVRFWLDAWLLPKPLISLATCDIEETDIRRSMNSYWMGTAWNFEMLNSLLPSDVILKLRTFFLSTDDDANDKMKWGLSPSVLLVISQ